MKIEIWPIDRPKDYEKNARKWSARAIEKVGASIREFGWRQPVVVDSEGVIVIGHLRRAAGKSIGLTECPVHVAADLTAVQIRALRLTDNRTNQESDWDEALLGPELMDLKALEFDLSLTGFDTRELDALLLTPDVDAKANACPDVPTAPVSRVGDLWRLGPHRVLCGNSTHKDAVTRLFTSTSGVVTPTLLVADPPYGVEYHPEWRAEAGVNDNRSKMGTVANDGRADWREAWALFGGDVMYVWHAGKHAAVVQASIEAAGFEIRNQIIWAKDRFALSRGNYHWQHEPCWYAVRNNAHWNGDRSQSTLWSIKSREDSGHGHGTQKPLDCMRRPMLNNSSPGQVVYDPFLGSGTSIIAAQITGRICYGIEINPAYCDVIVMRWEEFTGMKATLDGLGATFQHTAEGRLREACDAIAEEALTGKSI
ncbi:MAG TPA: DNA methyltransferase [Bryobacteraceae bacterium]|nr:DNA methyltransferase [Bryobacteraceae bacterium]